MHKINYNFSNFIKIKNCLSKRVAPDLTSVSRCARKYVYDHDVKYGAKCKKKTNVFKWNRRVTVQRKHSANWQFHFVHHAKESYVFGKLGIVFLLKIPESTYMAHVWTSAALFLLNGKEQREHTSEYHILCSTEKSQSYRLISV